MTDVYDPMNECRNKVANAQKYLVRAVPSGPVQAPAALSDKYLIGCRSQVSKVQRLQKQLKNSEEQYVKACIKVR